MRLAEPFTVHPRVCGEQLDAAHAPLARPRFIPACAGNRHVQLPAHRRWPVHPRVCGEQIAVDTSWPRNRRFIPACAGNSDVSGIAHCAALRFIPACAGNSAWVSWATSGMAGSSPRVRGTVRTRRSDGPRRSVHPRVCGEQTTRRCSTRSAHRFIPACAGNSRACYGAYRSTAGSSPRVRGTARRRARAYVATTVHPRVCGEQRPASSAHRP